MQITKRVLVAGMLASAVLVAPIGLSVTTGGTELGLVSAARPAYALPINTTSGRKTRKELEDAGYTCRYIATGFWECKKDGDTTYWCDITGACDEKPFIVPTHGGRTAITPGGGTAASQP